MQLLLSSSLQLLILLKTFDPFFWSLGLLYRFIVCALLRLSNGFKLVYWYVYTFLFSYCLRVKFNLLSSILHFYTSGTLFQIHIYNNRRLHVVARLSVQINSNYLISSKLRVKIQFCHFADILTKNDAAPLQCRKTKDIPTKGNNSICWGWIGMLQ